MTSLSIATTIVILLGPPGAGKGTQASQIKEKMSLPHISTGDLLRQNIASETAVGVEAKKYIEKGLLFPDDLMIDMLFARISGEDCAKGYILDGFPRTVAQAEAFEKRLGDEGRIKALYFDLPDDLILTRISGRIVCSACQTPFHRLYAPPKKEGECDSCHAPLIQRKDDSPEVVQERLRIYHAQTAPLIDFYRERKTLFSIDCNRSKEEIFNDLIKILD